MHLQLCCAHQEHCTQQTLVLQVALIQSMLQPASRTPAQAEAAANDADAAGHPQKDDASQDAVQVATVDSFQVTGQTGNESVT